MTTSHFLAVLVFGLFSLFGLLAWGRTKNRFIPLLFPIVGAVLGYFTYAIDHRVAATTLYELMVEGSVGVVPGTPAPVRTVEFVVEHPGVEHQLLIDPVSDEEPQSAVNISFSLLGPTGETLIPERRENFKAVPRTYGKGASKGHWDSSTFHFTPAVTGEHRLQLTPLTTGILRVHIRIGDPLKRNGKRMPGY